MRNKLIAALIAGGLLVGAGVVTSIVSSPSVALAQSESDQPEQEGFFQRGLSFLSDVLAGLVGDGTITQDQADEVIAATEAKAVEVRTERQAVRDLTKSLLEDGVITEAEAAQLPDNHPFLSDEYAEAWADGELTIEEIRQVRPHPRLDAFKRGARFGALLDDGGIDQAEYDQLIENLPPDSPLAQIDVSQYLDDGVITIDELREIFGGQPPFGWRHPAGPDSPASGDGTSAA